MPSDGDMAQGFRSPVRQRDALRVDVIEGAGGVYGVENPEGEGAIKGSVIVGGEVDMETPIVDVNIRVSIGWHCENMNFVSPGG